ncbi:MAG: hypothetical protein KKD89_07055 [Candidatus Omnitrophica bacterium]|nr:hypothetical protein [Candidatus Omnitrophota bacterium]
MAYVDMTGSTYFYYKALLTYQNMQQLAANDEWMKGDHYTAADATERYHYPVSTTGEWDNNLSLLVPVTEHSIIYISCDATIWSGFNLGNVEILPFAGTVRQIGYSNMPVTAPNAAPTEFNLIGVYAAMATEEIDFRCYVKQTGGSPCAISLKDRIMYAYIVPI